MVKTRAQGHVTVKDIGIMAPLNAGRLAMRGDRLPSGANPAHYTSRRGKQHQRMHARGAQLQGHARRGKQHQRMHARGGQLQEDARRGEQHQRMHARGAQLLEPARR